MRMPVLRAVFSLHAPSEAVFVPGNLRQVAASAPGGVYTVTRTYQGDRFVLLNAHLARLEESARLEGIEYLWTPAGILSALQECLEQAGFEQARVRIAIAGSEPERLDVTIEPLAPLLPELKAEGVQAATVNLDRRNPTAKTTEWEKARLAALAELPEECYEGLLLDDRGEILEGFTSNFYAVRSGTLHTAEEGILPGISRRILLEVAAGIIPIDRAPVLLAELDTISEAFLTSSSRGVVPIVSINSAVIGSGRPGPRTKELASAYDAWVDANMLPIGELLQQVRPSG